MPFLFKLAFLGQTLVAFWRLLPLPAPSLPKGRKVFRRQVGRQPFCHGSWALCIPIALPCWHRWLCLLGRPFFLAVFALHCRLWRSGRLAFSPLRQILEALCHHFLKHNFNSSTRPISVSKVRNLPGVFNRLATLDAVPPVYSSKNPPHNRMLYLVCSQVVSYQCPATVQPVTFKIIFPLIVLIDCGRTCNVKWTKLVVY